jgi:hypothetical protein
MVNSQSFADILKTKKASLSFGERGFFYSKVHYTKGSFTTSASNSFPLAEICIIVPGSAKAVGT